MRSERNAEMPAGALRFPSHREGSGAKGRAQAVLPACRRSRPVEYNQLRRKDPKKKIKKIQKSADHYAAIRGLLNAPKAGSKFVSSEDKRSNSKAQARRKVSISLSIGSISL